MTKWHEVHDSRKTRPPALDTASSTAVVYERQNIRQETREISMGEDSPPVTEWVYDQREYTKEEYAALTSPVTQAIMQAISDVELSVAMQESGGQIDV